MRVGVATGAIQVRPVINHCRFGLKLPGFLVAVGAGHRDVPSGKKEVRVLVPRQSERRRLVGFQIVTSVTGVEVRRRYKLRDVLVRMAIGATLELYFEQSILALGKMALGAFHPGVPAFQRIGAHSVFGHGER